MGRPSNDYRRTLKGILWILRTGAPWRALPERYGAWESVSGRFYPWRQTGQWKQILHSVQQQVEAFRLSAQVEARGELNWDIRPPA